MPCFRLVRLLLSIFFCLLSFGARAEYGPRFLVDQERPQRLDRSVTRLSYRFTCLHEGWLSLASVFCSAAQDPPLTHLGLYADKNGLPEAEALRSGEFTPQTGAWTSLAFDGIFLEKGKAYHLVLEPDRTVQTGEDGWAAFAATSPLNHLSPNGEPDPAAQTLGFQGKKWRNLQLQPVYALHLGYGRTEGNAYVHTLALPVFAGQAQAQVLHFNCQFTPPALQVRLRRRGSPASGLTCRLVELRNLQGHEEDFALARIGADSVQTEWSWIRVPLDLGGRQANAEAFYVALSTTAGRADGNSCRDCYELSAMEVPPGLQDAAQATFDGGAWRSRASSWSGGAWKDRDEADANVVAEGPDCQPFQNYLEAPRPLVPLPPRFSGLIPGGLP
jgi:hypothetical protein